MNHNNLSSNGHAISEKSIGLWGQLLKDKTLYASKRI